MEIWNQEQKLCLEKLYQSFLGKYTEIKSKNKVQFWTFYCVQNKIKPSYSINVEWTEKDKNESLIMLMEYYYLDSHNLIKID